MTRREARLRGEVQRLRTLIRLIFPYVQPHPGAEDLQATDVRDLRGVIEREKAAIGVLISLEEPTKPMRKEAADAGFYESPWGKHPRLQLRTVEELLSGKDIDRPPSNVTHKKAPKAVAATGKNLGLFEGGSEGEGEAADEE